MDVPDEPPQDPITAYLLNTFRNVCRGRRYISGMGGVFPMPLSAREISDWLDARPSPLPREEVDDVLFELDRLFMERDEDEDDQ
ncbi:hypothetical protein ALP12_101104 [Pseudomonas savastanoi pv. phaseolicola]|uniref:hypothetical protein n=1 Tax=Pseudomonas savastanoi TaxID=29438 RepID=UPI000F0053E3|nr:hypothetical protein [Pseudomonas savastanoi]RMV27967.1 hypothetical protein ALP12_101104 [Pseudomonas savastanoi pv. phaseolicola]